MSPRSFPLLLTAAALTACGGGGGSSPSATRLGSLSDADPAPEVLPENARPGATVGVTVAAPELSARGAVTYTLANSSNGAFAIGATTGVITLIGSVDYEAASRRTVTARAVSRSTRCGVSSPSSAS